MHDVHERVERTVTPNEQSKGTVEKGGSGQLSLLVGAVTSHGPSLATGFAAGLATAAVAWRIVEMRS